MGRTIGAAVALSAAVLMTQNAHAMSELEELMGEPMEALSDNELGELRGGFVTVDGVKFNIGMDVSETVNGEVLRRSTAVLTTLQDRLNQIQTQFAIRRREETVEQIQTEQKIETSVGGAPVSTSSSLSQVTDSGAALEATTTDTTTGMDQTATLTDDTMSFSTGTGTAMADDPDIGSTAAAAAAPSSSVFDVQMAVIETNNSNVLLNRVINLDIANYSMIDAMAARARVESKITSVVHSQVLFQLGQQF